ncbi:MaoC/PaaZ C-terminal domain-containing protein [Nocardioides yefusunii]|uniref:MaoC/PaaZ C-terminal domain-containing protein n=1 Tax=Nocardioides yefusunii TaxID=2500546 RepID=A0ABW1QS60_9ACTN|nr:MaoC/PaaZ C-terminal domain-containing protein [Nocardioides yefusunii]
MSATYVETDSVQVDADLVSTVVGRGGYTHPLFDVATHGESTPLPGQGVLLLAGGLVEQSGVLDDAVALLEMKSVRFTQMVRAGDTLRVRVTPGSHRATSSGKHVQEFAWQIVVVASPHGVDTVAEADIVMLMNTPVPGV